MAPRVFIVEVVQRDVGRRGAGHVDEEGEDNGDDYDDDKESGGLFEAREHSRPPANMGVCLCVCVCARV